MILAPTGERLRPVQLSDEQAVWETLRDWPSRPEMRREVRQNIEYSLDVFDPAALQQVPIPFIRFAMVVMEDSAGEFVGFCEWTYHPGEHSGFDIHRLAIHPDQRGQGHFAAFRKLLVFLANSVLEAEGAHYEYYADLESDGRAVGRADVDLKRRIVAGEVAAVETPSPMTALRDELGGVVMPREMVAQDDARISMVELDKLTVRARIDQTGFTVE